MVALTKRQFRRRSLSLNVSSRSGRSQWKWVPEAVVLTKLEFRKRSLSLNMSSGSGRCHWTWVPEAVVLTKREFRKRSLSPNVSSGSGRFHRTWIPEAVTLTFECNSEHFGEVSLVPNTNKQLINAATQSSYKMCRNIGIKFRSWTYMYICNTKNFRQTCDSSKSVKFGERWLSEIYLCRLHLKQGRQIQEFVFNF